MMRSQIWKNQEKLFRMILKFNMHTENVYQNLKNMRKHWRPTGKHNN